MKLRKRPHQPEREENRGLKKKGENIGKRRCKTKQRITGLAVEKR